MATHGNLDEVNARLGRPETENRRLRRLFFHRELLIQKTSCVLAERMALPLLVRRTRSAVHAPRCVCSRRRKRLCLDNPEGEGGSGGRASMHMDSIAASI